MISRTLYQMLISCFHYLHLHVSTSASCMHGERTDPSGPFVNLTCLGGIVDHSTATFSASQVAVLQKHMH